MYFDITGQLLIISSAFVKYLRKNGNKMKQCISFIDFQYAYDSVRMRCCIIFSLNLVSPSNW